MGDQRDKPFTPPVPRDHDDLTFSEMVPFRSTKIVFWKSPLFLLIVLSAIIAPYLFTLFGQIQTLQDPNAQLATGIRISTVALFFLTSVLAMIVYLYMRPGRPIWFYAGAYALLVGLMVTPILMMPFFYLFRTVWGLESLMSSQSFIPALIGNFVGAGMMEELMKGVPALLCLVLTLRARNNAAATNGQLYQLFHLRGPLDGALLGAFAGAAFIFVETSYQYVPNLMTSLARQGNLAGGLAMGYMLLLPRVFGGLVGHMAYAGIFGYFIGLAAIRPKHIWKLLAIGWVSAALIHGLWNGVQVLSPSMSYVIAGIAAVGVTAAMLKARQMEYARTGAAAETSGSIVVDRRGAAPVMPAAPAAMAPAFAAPVAPPAPPAPAAFTPPQPQAAPVAPAAPAAAAEAIALDIDGMMMPLRAGGAVDLAAEPALGGRGAGVKGSVISHPTRANVLGLRNDGTGAWSAVLRDGSTQMIAHDQSIRLAAGVRIQFADGLSGSVVKVG